jgi:alkylation response protein AidB-like acyl-CoA dehydrogenase
VLTAKTIVAYCISEAEAGSDVSGIKTTAVRVGGGWRLNEAKTWIHNAPMAPIKQQLTVTEAVPGAGGTRAPPSWFRSLQRCR